MKLVMTSHIRNRIAAIFLLVIFAQGLSGQQNQTQYFMNMPQANMANPAFRPTSKVYIGLPVLSGIYLSMNNNMLSLSEAFSPIAGTDSLMTILHPDYDREAFLSGLGRTGYLTAEASVQVLGVGFTINNDWYIDFSMNEKVTASAYIPSDLITFLLEGNESFLGSTIDLSGFGFEALQYLETSLGISKNINSKLRVGGRAKILFGGVGASLRSNDFGIDVNNDYSHTLHTDLTLNLSGPFDVKVDDDGLIEDLLVDDNVNPLDILLNSRNSGFAFDIGAEYKLLDNLSLSASIIDLGFIGWKSRTFNLDANNNFSFDGFDVSGVIAGDLTFDEMLDQFADSLKNSFVLTDGETRFGTGLPTKVFIGANYRPVRYLGLGVLSRTTINQGHMNQALSLSANLYAGEALSTSVVYTMVNRSYANLGFGLALKMGPVQFYTIVDQIPLTWDRVTFPDSEKPLPLPDRIDYLNLRLGFNLVFGKMKEQKRDTPMLLE